MKILKRSFHHMILSLCALALFNTGTALGAKPFSDLVFFGDSLSDPGNGFVLGGELSLRPFDLIPDGPYARGGLHLSNGSTWAEQFAQGLHMHTGPAYRNPRVFSNYAVGASRARDDLITQVNFYLSLRGGDTADSGALHVLFITGNDLRDALGALLLDPSGETTKGIIAASITALTDNIAVLVEAGASEFLVFNGPDLSLVPAVRLQGPLAIAAGGQLSAQYNLALGDALDLLESGLPPWVNLTRFDIAALFNEVVTAPADFGFTEVEATCINPGVIVKAACRNPQDYLFWDGIHPTKAAHGLIAERVLDLYR